MSVVEGARRPIVLPLVLVALATTSALAWLSAGFPPLPAAVIALTGWLLMLPLLAVAALPRDLPWAPLSSRLAAAAVLVWAHALTVIALLAWPLVRLQHAPSLPLALAVAIAAALLVLWPWRRWPALSLALREPEGDPPSARRRVQRGWRAALALTGTRDVFPSHGLPVLLLHLLLIVLPLLAAWRLSQSGWRVLVWVLSAGVGWAVYRFIHQRSLHALAPIVQAEPESGPVPSPLPIPDNPVLRAASLRASLRGGDIDHALAVLEAGVDPCSLALPDETDQRDALGIAATLNDSRPLRAMIAAGIDVNHRCVGLTPLLLATRDSYYGRPEIVLALIANGADIQARDEAGRTALHHAALSSEPSVLAMLLDAGAQVDAVDDEGYTPLAWACAHGNLAATRLLLSHRASASGAGRVPPLCAAAAATDDLPVMIDVLLRARAPVDATDEQGRSALHHAAGNGHAQAAKSLIGAGARVDTRDHDGQSPLQVACRRLPAESPMFALLIAAGAEPSELAQARTNDAASDVGGAAEPPTLQSLLATVRPASLCRWRQGATDQQRAELAYEAAVQGAVPALVAATAVPLPVDIRLPDGRGLVDAGIRLGAVGLALLNALPAGAGGGAGRLSMLLAATIGDVSAYERQALLWLEAGADPFFDAGGASPLHHAVGHGMEALVERLLERGADPARTDRAGITPLHLALRHNNERALRLCRQLLRHGGKPHAAAGSGETPLALALDADRPALVEWLRWRGWHLPGRRLIGADLVAAARLGDLGAVRRLLTLGLGADSRDRQGCTALIRAAGGGHQVVLAELLAHEADIGARTPSGVTALSAAIMAGHGAIVDTLLARGVIIEQRLANDTTALMVAAACGNRDAVVRLLAATADVAARDGVGNRAVHAAAGHAFGAGDGEVVRAMLLALLAAGAEIDAGNEAGLTALHIACGAAAVSAPNAAGIDAALDVLLSRSRAVNGVDRHGCTPLHYAAAQGQLGAVRRLLGSGAQRDLRDRGGWRAEDYAVQSGYTDVAQLLRSETAMPSLPLRPA